MYKLPTDIIYKIQEFEPLADVYPEIEESKRSTWLKQKIRERSYIPDDQLVYEIQESNLSAYYVILDIKAGEIITDVTIKKQSKNPVTREMELELIASTLPLEGLNKLFVSNTDYLKFFRHIYVRGIRVYNLVKETDINTYEIKDNGIRFPESNGVYLTDKDFKEIVPRLVTIADTLPNSIPYPDTMKLYHPFNKSPIHFLDGCFRLLYQLATVNRYWNPSTYYMLDMTPKFMSNATLLPKGTNI
jgi:hypothetical protein